MPLIRYVGPHDEVVITVAQIERTVARGATVDVPAEVAVGFLEQPDNWEAEKAPKTKDGA